MKSTILARAQALAPRLVEIRHTLHRYPELGFQEHRTAALVAATLGELGIPFDTGVGRTGVVGHVGKAGPIVALRADMDALPIQEANDVPYASQAPGVMHACGHDVHTACLLGAAMLLRDVAFEGRVRLLFQPAEEGPDAEGKSGAMRMIEDGAFEGVSVVFGSHVHSDYPTGAVLCTPGRMAASMANFRIVIKGTAAHAAYAYQGVDAILLAAQVVTALHTIVSRRIPPLEGGAISVGTIHGGTKENNLADEVELRGTVRSLDAGVQSILVAEMERACALARTLGGDYEFHLQGLYPVVINDAAATDLVRRVASEMVGEARVMQRPPELGGEDFALFANLAPGCLFELGVQAPGRPVRPVHSPNFDVDESVLPLGAALLAQVALTWLQEAHVTH